jgi:hypothetical protein
MRRALVLASALISACASSSQGEPHGAGGAANPGGSGNESGDAAGQGGVAQSGTGNAGNAGRAAEAIGGDAANAGVTTGGDAGGSDDLGAGSIFVEQIVVAQGGGPAHCLPRSLPSGPPGASNDGRVRCLVAEFKPEPCDCAQAGRAPIREQATSAMTTQLRSNGVCGGDTGQSCDSFCGCEIIQAPGVASDSASELFACQNELTTAEGVDGFCLIDQARVDANGTPAPLGNAALVAECPKNSKSLLRFVGAGYPAVNATLFIGCTG